MVPVTNSMSEEERESELVIFVVVENKNLTKVVVDYASVRNKLNPTKQGGSENLAAVQVGQEGDAAEQPVDQSEEEHGVN